MQTIENYNIHDLLKVQIRAERKKCVKGLNWPLEFFRIGDRIENPEIVLNIGRFSPDMKGIQVVGGGCFAKDDHLFLISNDKESEWQAEITGMEKGPVNINFYGKMKGVKQFLAPDGLAQDQLLLPMIEILLGRKGHPLLHGGGFSNGNEGITIIGGSGSKKTTFIMKAARNGMKVIGDERIILAEGCLAYPMPIWPRLLEFTIEKLHGEDMNIFNKTLLLHYLKKDGEPSSIWTKHPTVVSRSYILSKKRGLSSPVLKKISTETGTKKIVMDKRTDFSDSHLSRGKRKIELGFDAYCLINPNSRLCGYWEALEEKLRSILSLVLLFQIDIPSNSTLDTIDAIFNQMIK